MAGHHKLNRDQIEEVYIELRSGELEIKDIAKSFGISVASVTNINVGKYYQDPLIKYPIRERGKDHPRLVEYKPEPSLESDYWDHHYPESWDIRSI
ncbi:MAG: hypothetical protein VW683_09630 [Betaproteobacteria bacterium]